MTNSIDNSAIVLADLKDRLIAARRTLKEMSSEAFEVRDLDNYARLDAKGEGVALALSYLEELTR